METEIFANLGASPIVMDFAEVPTALETGIIEGTDYSTIGNNVSIGLYDIVDHATYPGFHSMPSDHVTIRKDVWDSLPDDLKRIIDVAAQKLAFQTALAGEAQSNKYAAELRAKGVNLYDWSEEDRATFRAAAQDSWKVWGEKSPEAKALVESHTAFMKDLGLVK
jgi:TRAP-type C4-dicarboxylate transport system substrate-binding protein